MKKKSMISSVFIAMMATFVLLLEPVAGALIAGSSGEGETLVTSSTCDATVAALVPPFLDVDNGDTVRIYYNVSWEDTRSYPQSEPAEHYFNLTAEYFTGPYYADDHETTYGDDSGEDYLYVDVRGVLEFTRIVVTWYASIGCGDPECSDDDSVKDRALFLV